MTGGNEARRLCPDIRLVKVPEKRGKADLTCYREAGAEVISILARFADLVERASIDEAFLDITERVAQRLCELGQARVTPEMLPATHVAGLCPRGDGKGSGSASASAGGSKHRVCPLRSTEDECSASPLGPTEGPLGPSGVQDEGFGFQDDLTVDESDDEVASEEGFEGNPGSIQSPLTWAHLSSVGDSDQHEDLPSWLVGVGEERCLAVGALIAREMRRAVWEEAGFSCSAGIAHNKVPLVPTSRNMPL